MCQWFAPTKFNITFQQDGSGALTQEEIESIVIRDKNGSIEYLNLPTRFVLTANHQVRTHASRSPPLTHPETGLR